MPEAILPCPACGCDRVDTHTPEGDTRLIYIIPNAYVSCDDCDMRGPLCSSDHAAIAAWNALPRALTWTHETPKVAGWYWIRQQGESFDLIQHYNQNDIDAGFDNERRLKQWAGPIAPPVD